MQSQQALGHIWNTFFQKRLHNVLYSLRLIRCKFRNEKHEKIEPNACNIELCNFKTR